MKIKLFEEYTEYEIGYYVLLQEKDTVWRTDVAEILDKKQNPLEFLIRTFYLESGREFICWIYYSEIEKKISFEEFKEIKRRNFIDYKIKKGINKFNL